MHYRGASQTVVSKEQLGCRCACGRVAMLFGRAGPQTPSGGDTAHWVMLSDVS